MPSLTWMLVSRMSPRRIFGPERSCMMVSGIPVSSSTFLMSSMMRMKFLAEPWEKFSRKMRTPASARARILSLVLEAGPMVATILVLLIAGNLAFVGDGRSLGIPPVCALCG